MKRGTQQLRKSTADGPCHQALALGDGEDEQRAQETHARAGASTRTTASRKQDSSIKNSCIENASMRKAIERSTIENALSDEAPRKRMNERSEAHQGKSSHAHETNKSIATWPESGRSASGKATHSRSAPSPPRKRVQKKDRDVDSCTIGLLGQARPPLSDRNSAKPHKKSTQRSEGAASNAIESTSSSTGTASVQTVGCFERILLLVFNACCFVAMLPVTIVKAVLSDQPPWSTPSSDVETLQPAGQHDPADELQMIHYLEMSDSVLGDFTVY